MASNNNMNYEFYINNYSGNCVNIAVIDCGIVEKIVKCKKHYMISDDEAIQEIKEPNELVDYHGTYCAQEIKKVAKNATIYDFNVADEKHIITEKRIIKALEYILSQDIDIVSISMKLDFFSEQLLNVVEEAYKKGVFILAASDNVVSYPADLEYVLRVKSNPINEEIMHVNKKTVCIGKSEYTYNIGNKVINLEPSSSLACAYYAGVLALIIEGNVLLSFEQICDKLEFFNFQYEEIPNKTIVIDQNTAIIDTSHEPTWYISHKQLLDSNIIGFFDVYKECFVSYDNSAVNMDEIEHIIEINFEHYEKQSMANQTRFKKIPYCLLGNFGDSEHVINCNEYDSPDVEFIKYIEKPIIYIAGFACGTQKYETLIQLYKQFTDLGVRCGTMTNNPLGYIMGMSAYEYPKEIIYPKIVYQLNETMDCISRKGEIDMVLVDIPGGITKLNWHNEYNFGMLFKAFLMAADADIVIIMLNQGIIWDDIKRETQQITSNNVPNIIFCISEFVFDMSTVESETGVQLTKTSESDNEQFYQEALEQLPEYKVFRYQDLLDGNMVKYILSLYQ